MVVHREPEEDHEEQERQEGVDPAGELETEELLAPAVLEDEDEDAVGRADREQVEQDCFRCDHDGAEGDEHQPEREQQHEAEDERRDRLHLIVEIARRGGHAGDGDLGCRAGLRPSQG